jgi:hypothetical protein
MKSFNSEIIQLDFVWPFSSSLVVSNPINFHTLYSLSWLSRMGVAFPQPVDVCLDKMCRRVAGIQ